VSAHDREPHTCAELVSRSTFSVTAVQKGISPALQRPMEHDHRAVAEIYLNLSTEHVLKEFVDKA